MVILVIICNKNIHDDMCMYIYIICTRMYCVCGCKYSTLMSCDVM